MTLKEKKVFVSGGNGVIGNELVERLYNQGAIILVGDLKPRPLHWSPDIIYRQGDLNYITKEELYDFGPEYFFHLAATFERSTETYEFWDENHWHNVRLSTYLMGLLKDLPSLKKVIFASSYLIYNPELYQFDQPTKKAYRLNETDPIYPRNLTGVAKLNHEIELRFLNEFRSNQFKTVIARIYRSYGKNSRDVISRWIRMLLNNETLTVFRKEGMFDYIYAGDVAEGLLRLALNTKATGVFNLGNDNARSVNEVLTILKEYFPNLNYIEVESDIPYEASQANMDYFYKIIGWKPQCQLEDTIPKLITFEKEFGFNQNNEQVNINVLVTSISKKIPMLKSIRQACKKISTCINVFGADTNPHCIGKYFTDDFWTMPSLETVSIADIIEYCKKKSINAIIPSRDGELMFWALHKAELNKHGIAVMVSDSNAIETCIDKLKFYTFCMQHQFNAIQTVKDINDLVVCNCYVVKEQFGAGSLSIGLKLSKQQAIEHAKTLINPIFQPFIKGTEFSVDVYIPKNNKAKGAIVRCRDVIVNGESQITTLVNEPELEKVACNLCEQLNLYGHVVLQVIKDENNKFHFIECNSRFGGASTLSINCGLDSFYWFLLEALGNDISQYPFIKPTSIKKQIRFSEDIIITEE